MDFWILFVDLNSDGKKNRGSEVKMTKIPVTKNPNHQAPINIGSDCFMPNELFHGVSYKLKK